MPVFLDKRPPTSLLKDRLTVRLPENARIEARGHSIMAAPQLVEEETRAVLDAGGERFVIMVSELFERGGADPDRNVRAAVAARFPPPAPRVEPLAVADPSLKAWAVFPESVEHSREAIQVLAVLTLHPDGFVQLLQFYVNPPAAGGTGCGGLARAVGAGELPKLPGGLPTCTALSHAIASTLGAGPRRIDTAGGERELKGQYADDSFFVKVPAGASATMRPGPDFTVHRVRFPVELGAPQPTLGIYVGGHPSYQYKQSDAKVTPTPRAGQLLGKSVTWQVWKVDPERVMAEVIVPHPKSEGARIHVFASAGDEKALTPVLEVAASLRLP